MTDAVNQYENLRTPTQFTQAQLDWLPWLNPVAQDALTERHIAGLVDAARAKSPYFRLLSWDPEILEARTRTDKDIFYNPEGGLPRAERELAAAATSRHNGCIYCASVHARFANHFAKDEEQRAAVQALLEEGVGTQALPERWQAIVDAATALSDTPPSLNAGHIQRLREVGLDEEAVIDAISAASFFNWANRLMLSLGEPELPAA